MGARKLKFFKYPVMMKYLKKIIKELKNDKETYYSVFFALYHFCDF